MINKSMISRLFAGGALLLVFLVLTGCASSEVRGAKKGDLESVREYVEAGGDVNARQKGGMTLLMYASAGGHIQIIEYLMSNGADLHIKDDRGYTALLHSAGSNMRTSMESLLGYGASINDRSVSGETAMFLGADRNYHDLVDFLLARGADYQTGNNAGWTPLLAALRQSANGKEGFTRSYDLLVKAGAIFDETSSQAESLAFTAARSGNLDVLDLLMQEGVNPLVRDGGENTLLHAGTGHINIVEYLLGHDIPVDSLNKAGETPLIVTAARGGLPVLELLLGRGAGVDIKDDLSLTALLHASKRTDPEFLRVLILKGATIYVTDANGNTALHYAAALGTEDTVRLLLTAGIYVDSANKKGETPYIRSFENEERGEAIRRVLVTAGAVVPAQEETPVEAPAQEVTVEEPASAQENSNVFGLGLAPGGTGSEAEQEPEPVTETPASAEEVTEAPATVEPAAIEPTADEPVIIKPEAAEPIGLVKFSWPRINPSRADGWNNSDKITGQALLSLIDGTREIYSEEIEIPMKGVNGDAFTLERELSLDSDREFKARLIIETKKGGRLICETGGESYESGIMEFYFEDFLYETE